MVIYNVCFEKKGSALGSLNFFFTAYGSLTNSNSWLLMFVLIDVLLNHHCATSNDIADHLLSLIGYLAFVADLLP